MIHKASSFCWHCRKNLMFVTGGKGARHFAIVVDPIGNRHRVHKGCVKDAIGNGIKELKEQPA